MTRGVAGTHDFDLVLWANLHEEGLKRVATVVDGNVNYDDLLEYRLTDQDRLAYDASISLAAKKEAACAHIRLHLLNKPHKVTLPRFSGFVSEGSTVNNDREYAFFERICAPLGIAVQTRNYSDSGTVRMGPRSDAEEALLQRILESAQQYYRSRDNLTAGLVRQLTLYTVSFFRSVVAFHRNGAIRPSVLVQANDHSPVRVAMSMTMKGLNVPRIYLQHAEVTSYFPPLDFEYSVLRNARSKEIYAGNGPVGGEIYIISRQQRAFDRQRLASQRQAPVPVVIYPTSRVLVDELKDIVAALLQNSGVAKVVIKQHPAAARQLHDVFSGFDVHFADTTPREDHVALVGNSSIVTELLHAGIPVFQNFDFDPVADDYYGFVASGLTKLIGGSEFSGPFWESYSIDQRWLTAFERLDPTVNPDHQAEETRFLAEMQRLKAATVQPRRTRIVRGAWRAQFKAGLKRTLIAMVSMAPGVSGPVLDFGLSASSRLGSFLTLYSYLGANYLRNRTNIVLKSGRKAPSGASGTAAMSPVTVSLIEQTLCDLQHPAAWIARNEHLGVFAEVQVVAAIENMFQSRRPELGAIFDGYQTWQDGSPIGTWIYLKRAEWANIALPADELDRIQAFVAGLSSDQFSKSLLEKSLLGALIRHGGVDQIEAFWKKSTSVTPESIGTNTRINLLQKLYSEPGQLQYAVSLRQRFETTSSQYEHLKLRNMDYLAGRPVPGWSHTTAEELFQSLSPAGAAREFGDIARPFYHRFRSQMALMEIRTNASQSDRALDIMHRALVDGRPFSFVRLSDGEGYLFPDEPHFTAEDARNRERHWWDTELPPDLSTRVIQEARQAVSEADVIGVPAVYRFIRDTADTSRALSQSLQGRGLLQVLAGLPALLSENAILSEDKMNVSLFSHLENTFTLAKVAKRTILVGSVKHTHLPLELTSLPNLKSIQIPTHARTARNDIYQPNTQALPFVYNSVLDELSDVGSGDLVLVAGGIIGKIFLGHARRHGAVAIDIGSVLDDWVNVGQTSLR